MGIAARFTLGLGLLASIFASIAAFVLLQGIQDMGTDLVDEAQREMVAQTVKMEADEARRGAMEMKAYSTSVQIPVQVGVGPVSTLGGELQAKVFLANRPARPNVPSEPVTMYAPADLGSDTAMRVLALVVLVCGALVAATVMMGALTARRLTAPLNEMVEDVLAISRGHLDRKIGGEDAVGEVAHLAVAMDRMVDDLLESQENQEALAASEAEAENLRELRRHLQPMRIEAPTGWAIEACLIEAATKAELEDAFVQVRELGDFSISYRVSGLLVDVKRILTMRSDLAKQVLDALHAAQIEIVSPTVMSTRVLGEHAALRPTPSATPAPEAPASQPEALVFDKADEAENLESRRKRGAELLVEIEELRAQRDAAAAGSERERLEGRLTRMTELKSALDSEVKAREKLLRHMDEE